MSDHIEEFAAASKLRILRDLTLDKNLKPRTVQSTQEAATTGLPIGTEYFVVVHNGKELVLGIPPEPPAT